MDIRPINRVNRYMSDNYYKYYIDLIKEYIGGANGTFYFIKINKEQSQIDDLYGEAYNEEITYNEPIEVPAIINLEASTSDAYINNKGLMRKEEYGNLILHVFLKDLEELGVEITYGDFVGYRVFEDQIIYFEVSDDSQKYFENKNTLFGYKSFIKTITCAPTDTTFNIEL